MKRFFMTALVAAVGLTLFAVGQTQAGEGYGHHGGRSYHRHEYGHNFRANPRFGYGKYGYRSFSWSRSYWSSHYNCYCYWAPSYGWCFYEPTHAYYVPVTRFYEVYPESVPVLRPSPSVIQQTTVVTVPPTRTVVPPPVPEVGPAPAPVPVPGPAPAPPVIQKTNVGGDAP